MFYSPGTSRRTAQHTSSRLGGRGKTTAEGGGAKAGRGGRSPHGTVDALLATGALGTHRTGGTARRDDG